MSLVTFLQRRGAPLCAAAVALSTLALVGVNHADAAGTAVYDAIPSPLPVNVPSYGMEAYQMDEIGDHIAFQGGATNLDSMTVFMSSWACQTGSWDAGTCHTDAGATFQQAVTVNLYNVDLTKIASITQTFAMPYRPSANPACSGGRWQAANGSCFNGMGFPITFDLHGLTVPAEIIYGISYNTSTSGPNPTHAQGPADSLNVGMTDGGPTVGTDVNSDVVFVDSTYPDMNTGDAFGPNTGWNGWTPAVEFSAAPNLTVENCKNGGYASRGFRNQGQCIASVVGDQASGK